VEKKIGQLMNFLKLKMKLMPSSRMPKKKGIQIILQSYLERKRSRKQKLQLTKKSPCSEEKKKIDTTKKSPE
jgi:hypothetical protein